MNSRSKKYHELRKANRVYKKGRPSTKAGYNEQNEKTLKEPKKNLSPPKSQDHPGENARAEQDNTSGPNNSGKRMDEN